MMGNAAAGQPGCYALILPYPVVNSQFQWINANLAASCRIYMIRTRRHTISRLGTGQGGQPHYDPSECNGECRVHGMNGVEIPTPHAIKSLETSSFFFSHLLLLIAKVFLVLSCFIYFLLSSRLWPITY
jgi:hypothetical protein